MVQFASVGHQRQQALYWNAELALSISLHHQGRISGCYLSELILVVTNIDHKKCPFAHRFNGRKEYSHE